MVKEAMRPKHSWGGTSGLAGVFLLLCGGFAAMTAGCNIFLGIEDVEEIQPTGTGGTGGAGGGTGGECVPMTCETLGWACGTGDDGCGTPLTCPECEVGYACNNNIHECVCQPDSCESLGWQCGTGIDHCMVDLNCPPCQGSDSCVDHVCQCTPVTCQDLGWQCGSTPDGCGGTAECTCVGALAVCNQNHQCECTPVDPCPSVQCGDVDNGCGTAVNCGNCSNVCGFAAACNAGTCDCNMPQ